MADLLNGIFISEVLADNAGGNAIDTDGDGRTNKSDEFIEIQSNTGAPVSLDGYELWSEKNGQLFSFDAADTLNPGETATVVGNYTGTPPSGFYDAGIAERSNWLPDGERQEFDTIFLVDSTTGDYIALSYGDPPRTPTLPSGFPGTNQVGAGESIDSDAPNGIAFARDANGDLEETSPTPDTPNVPCFLEGTCILTQRGRIAVEDLNPGDRILTKDNGYTPVLGIGRFTPTVFERGCDHDMAPVFFPAGSVGNARGLSLSASHRVLFNCASAELLFGEAEVLVSGRNCVGHNGITVSARLDPPVYFHILFSNHEIICAEGSWVESLFLADVGVRALSHAECWQLAQGLDVDSLHHSQTARHVLKRAEAQILLAKLAADEPSDAVAAA